MDTSSCSSNILTAFETEVLRTIAGESTGEPMKWGAAMGAALEYLEGINFVSMRMDSTAICYEATSDGKEYLRCLAS